jgi:hypothetical protein
MKLPNRTKAVIPVNKVTDYLMSKTHPVGRFKADFFLKIGFSKEHEKELEQLLLKIAQEQDVVRSISTTHGTKYIIHGTLVSPTGVRAELITVWIIEQNQENPRFVTAYPQ